MADACAAFHYRGTVLCARDDGMLHTGSLCWKRGGESMMHVLLVCIGGFFGAAARFFVFRIMAQKGRATLTVNTLGSFFIGMLAPLMNEWQQLLIVLGFLGAFTTFSTFALDAVQLAQGSKKIALFYVLQTLFYGAIAVCIGYVIALAVAQ